MAPHDRVCDLSHRLNSANSFYSIGCTAFPLALHLIDLELQPKYRDTTSQTIVVSVQQKQQQLGILLETMSTYQPRYYIADWVMKTVRHVVGLARQWSSERPLSFETLAPTSACWRNMLQTEPSHYLRLAMTMDLSISHGKLPEENDFPPSLRQGFHVEASQASCRGVMNWSIGGFSNLDLPSLDMMSSAPRISEVDIDEEPTSQARYAEDLTDLLTNDSALMEQSQSFPEQQETNDRVDEGDPFSSTSNQIGDNLIDSNVGNSHSEGSCDMLSAMTNISDEPDNLLYADRDGGQNNQLFRNFLGELNAWLGVENKGRNKAVIGMDVDGLDL